MPPKNSNKSAIQKQSKSDSKSKKTSKAVDDTDESEIVEDAEDLPALDFVSDNTKERYEYKPVVRTEIVYRRPEDRLTTETMTKFELCEVISIRAKQLEQGRVVFTDVGDLTDPIAIAKKEIIDKKCPLSIVRMITDKIAEKWQVNELGIPYDAM